MTRGRWFDAAVFVIGMVSCAVGAVPWIVDPGAVTAAHLVVPLSVLLLAQFPLELSSRGGHVVIGFEAAALVYLALASSAGEALTLWAVAMLCAHGLLSRKELSTRLFNMGCTAASGTVLVVCVGAGAPAPGMEQLVLVAVGCAAYFLTDLLVTSLSLAVISGARLRDSLPLRSVPLPLAVFLGIDSLGYLAYLLDLAYVGWALVLLFVPLLTIAVAARSLSRARASESRTAALLVLAQAGAGTGEILELLEQQLQVLVPHARLSVHDAPVEGVWCVPVPTVDRPERCVAVTTVGAGRQLDPKDRETAQMLIAVAAESSERRRLVEEMTQMARFDALTGLANRTLFADRLTQAAHRLRRHGGSAAVLYVDLDGFKGVNDRLGHVVGDEVLVAAAERISRVLRESDTAARLGGDEFAVLLEDLTDADEAVRVGERIVAAVGEPFDVKGQSVRLGASVGIAESDGSFQSDALLRSADMAMYRAKAFGKGRVELFDPRMRRQTEHRMRLEDELRLAVENETLDVAPQPVVDLASGRIDGFEALLRWNHPALGAVPPDVLLPVAEQLGLMTRLGRWVAHEAHRQAVLLSDAAGRQITMAVNVVAEQLADDQFLDELVAFGRDPRVHMVCELTERAFVDETLADRALRRLHDAGITIAIDDFGIGYSSIGYLHRYDCIDIVKIDRSFVQTVVTDPRTRALVESIIAMANAFEAVVVAEGIEDEAARAALQEIGCSLGQGYLFSPAVPLEVAIDLLRTEATIGAVVAPVVPLQRRGGVLPV